MTSEQLIAEGRKLQKPTFFLRAQGPGPVAAVWHERDEDEIESTGHHCWLTVDARVVPGLPPSVTGYLSIFTNEESCEGGQIEITPAWPKRPGTKLYAHSASVLPPIDAVFLRGSDAVGAWLKKHGWERDWGYNGNFKDKAIVGAYQDIFTNEYPLYFESDIFAVVGGWHMTFPDPDWDELIDDQFLLMTIRDSEPWVEAWQMKSGEFEVIQRIT